MSLPTPPLDWTRAHSYGNVVFGSNAERSGTENEGVRAKAPIVRENDVGGSRAMSQITYTY